MYCLKLRVTGVFIMKSDTEEQILEELRNLNKSMERLERKVDIIDEDGKPVFVLWDMLKSLLIGVVIVGPTIAVIVAVLYVLYSWLFG